MSNGLNFEEVRLQEVNLFVGVSGSGKSRFLSSFFNVARFAIGNELNRPIFLGQWELEAEINGSIYKWVCKRESDLNNRGVVLYEQIKVKDNTSNEFTPLVSRTTDRFQYNNSNLPKLDFSKSCIELLKDEDLINPIYQGFRNVIRRKFSHGGVDNTLTYLGVDKSFEKNFENSASRDNALYSLFNLPLNLRLYLIKKYLINEYNEIIIFFKQLFPNIDKCSIVNQSKEKSIGGYTPVFMVTEKGVENKIQLNDLSSGMIKVLLILTDIITMPKGFIYELDEYENSLGINVINFLPSLLLEHQSSKQFLITTHHPYLINKMPISNWYVFSRKGNQVKIKYGEELIKKYGKSSQDSFIKLINDPFYSSENI
ncbi:TPA: AAA family ATPase [Legionella pneumophila]|nr:AAA family ATPase [Legionella pneumophila]HAT1883613.1 ATP-binding protein [Legionella pneumophila]HAT2115333.1 ATP-binding protein [Legionella pneumophila]